MKKVTRVWNVQTFEQEKKCGTSWVVGCAEIISKNYNFQQLWGKESIHF